MIAADLPLVAVHLRKCQNLASAIADDDKVGESPIQTYTQYLMLTSRFLEMIQRRRFRKERRFYLLGS